jgi:TusA-related sulfurtransferase
VIPGFDDIIEQRIRESMARGEFDDLPGRGKPLHLEDDSHIPEDLRLAYKVLKNANCLPPEVELRKDIRQMKDMLDAIPDEKEKVRQIRKINYKIMKLNAMGRGSPLFEESEIYYRKVVDKLESK